MSEISSDSPLVLLTIVSSKSLESFAIVICFELNLVVFPKNCISRFFNLFAAIALIVAAVAF